MSGKTILELASPVTQSREAVVAMLNYLNRTADPLPEVVDLGAVKLVLSNKKDAYYTVSAKACSCPSATYRPGQPCKHQRKYFPRPAPQAARKQKADDAGPSLRPTEKWFGGHNGPVPIEMI